MLQTTFHTRQEVVRKYIVITVIFISCNFVIFYKESYNIVKTYIFNESSCSSTYSLILFPNTILWLGFLLKVWELELSFLAYSTKACFTNFSAFFQLPVNNKWPFFPPYHSLCFPSNVSVTTTAAGAGPGQTPGTRLPKIVLDSQSCLYSYMLNSF